MNRIEFRKVMGIIEACNYTININGTSGITIKCIEFKPGMKKDAYSIYGNNNYYIKFEVSDKSQINVSDECDSVKIANGEYVISIDIEH